jgi:3-oxo-5-alpha-steroid 4-dehydrogenase 1
MSSGYTSIEAFLGSPSNQTLSAVTMVVSGLSAASALLCFVNGAPYGRYFNNPSASYYTMFLPSLPAPVAWLLQELPSFFCPLLVYHYFGSSPLGYNRNTLLLLAFLTHYFNRSFVFPLRIKGGKPTPFGVFIMAFAFCVWNGVMQGAYLAFTPLPPPSPRFWAGLCLWAYGLYINMDADAILRRLRSKPGDKKYYIPRGGAFELVSGANFLGEILEWSGFAIAAYTPLQLTGVLGTLQGIPILGVFVSPPVAFAFFTACNIGPRALEHHRWYVETFKKAYPKDRKALIPFIL